MKKQLLLVAIATTISFFSYSQNGRENWFPNKGNVGIGTRSPSSDLEVIGDIRATNKIYAPTFETPLLLSTTFRNSGDGYFLGKLGIGISNPLEKLHVVGNFKLDGNLTANQINLQQLSAIGGQFTTLGVTQNAWVNGSLGIGTNTPQQKLHIVGNVLVEQNLNTSSLTAGVSTFSENATFQKNITLSGKLGVGVTAPVEALEVSGNIKTTGGLYSASLNSGSVTLESLAVSGNSAFTGNVGVGTTTPSEKLHVDGNLSVNQELFSQGVNTETLSTGALTATGAAGFAEDAHFSKQLVVAEKLGVGTTSPSEALDINGNGKFSGAVNATQGSFANGLTAGNSTINGTLQVNGAIHASGFSASGVASFPEGFSAGGNAQVNNLTVAGNINAANIALSDLNTTGNASVGQALSVTQNLSVGGAGAIGGNLDVSGDIKANVIEANEIRKADGTPLFDLANAVVSQTLSVATNRAMPANYKLAVGGNIIATGLDIKIPQAWPDYVFTDGYKLLTIEEVQAYLQKHGHLPGVPSASEMQAKENYSVSEMDAKLLEKIEELTLYIIELKKELNAIKKK